MNTQEADLPSPPTFDVSQFKELYKRFDRTTLAKLPYVYSPSIIFKDPIHHLRGISELNDYFAGFCQPGMQCQFDITNEVVSGHQAFFQWQMHYRHPRLEGGRPLKLEGGSLIKFTDKITFHEDFYDMGAMIYQHLPGLGWIVKKINQRIAGTAS